jgi:chemotaxis protein MotB
MKLVMTIALATAACVSNGTYNKKIEELNAASKQREDALSLKIKELEGKIKELEGKLETLQSDLEKTNAEKGSIQAQLDNAKELDASLTQRLEKAGQSVDSLSKEKADVASRLEELKKQKAAADARIATFRNLLSKLRAMIDSGQLKVAIRGGRMIIALPNDILFDSGKTEVKTEGKNALEKVAQVLATVGDRDFLVAGHTDNVPIKMPKFPSNWELSTARAVEVVHFLIAKGMKPKVLAAAGYGEFDPVVANDTPEHRAQNRRIEIVLQPNLGDLPPLDDLNPTPPPAKK